MGMEAILSAEYMPSCVIQRTMFVSAIKQEVPPAFGKSWIVCGGKNWWGYE